jgi:hypothetical protein
MFTAWRDEETLIAGPKEKKTRMANDAAREEKLYDSAVAAVHQIKLPDRATLKLQAIVGSALLSRVGQQLWTCIRDGRWAH